MTEELDMSAIPEQPEVKGDAAKVLRWINTLLLMLGGILAWDVHQNVEDGRREGKERMSTMEAKFISLDKSQAMMGANLYTSMDHVKYAESVTSIINTNEKRISRLEDGMTNLKDGQNAMMNTLNAIRSGLGISKEN